MSSEPGKTLLAIARHAIAQRLGDDAPAPDAAAFQKPGASFVTLTRSGRLRGCIGSLSPTRSLCDDVKANALAAAFKDPRFPPLGALEWPDVKIEVSVLGATEWRNCPSLADAIAWLRPHRDGAILEDGGRRATFLPQVWESLPDPNDFLAELRRKAGMRSDTWPETMKVGRYPVLKYRET
ncbi:AmmeMemoRadiSam system protein A [Niveibacterium sp. 24ML]|uniref:AmmeMemoRadiSam system protein A n=1 Tax=Niveibacterium sp. 24ML TaxID=2985512 RepID=UPI00226E7658|nr:AmmeMemoRadiSam system protein A [Niveibacterium sp. 24ML]MCX9156694.1 AmmeMemoRadiSam system protein A [Niveibacterium sp. 24ML]